MALAGRSCRERTVYAGETTSTEIANKTRLELRPEDGIETLFFDETMTPGRWTFVVTHTTIDVMIRKAIVDERWELAPGDTLVLQP